jgi:TIR domain
MKVFISWSGEPSRSIALALRQWLPLVVQHAMPWMSDEEIASGTRWNESMTRALDETEFGIVCVTLANQHQPWLMFEAGAIAKRLRDAAVVPLCIDLPPAEVTGPLVTFQGRSLDKEGMRRLVHDISSVREQPLDNDQVNVLFEALWPRLEEQVKKAKKRAPDFDIARRSSRGMLEELVERTRNIERKGDLAVSGESLNRIYERIKILQSILLRLMNTVAEIGPGPAPAARAEFTETFTDTNGGMQEITSPFTDDMDE